MDHPRDGEITSTIDDFWEAVAVDGDDVTTSPYANDNKDGTVGCDQLPEDDRWIAYRTSQLPGELYDQDQLWERGNRYLEENSFELSRFSDPDSTAVLSARAEKDDLVVYFDVQDNGYAHLEVVSGPCATRMGQDTPTGMVPID